jgi:DNA-binding NarL/FixJ family response regulator
VDDEFAVLTFPLAPITLPDSLTEAERSVARALLAGESNAQIAAARHTSVRTIVSQVSSLMRKLHVQSRAEALAVLCRTGVRAKQRPS